MRGTFLKTLVSLSLQPIRQIALQQCPRNILMKAYPLATPQSLLPPPVFCPSAWPNKHQQPIKCKDTDCDCRIPRRSKKGCCHNKYKCQKPCPVQRKPKPCKRPRKCPKEVFKKWDECDPWAGTRRSKKNMYLREAAKLVRKSDYIDHGPKGYCGPKCKKKKDI